MNDVIGAKPPIWFRIVAVLAVLWNLMGVWSYLAHVGAIPPMKPMTAGQEALAATVPSWVVGAFAVAVFSAVLASLGWLMLKSWSRMLFALSLLCIIAQMAWIVFISDARAIEGNMALLMPVLVTAIGLLNLWLTSLGVRKGWLT